jgi:hypothetical protein
VRLAKFWQSSGIVLAQFLQSFVKVLAQFGKVWQRVLTKFWQSSGKVSRVYTNIKKGSVFKKY